MSVKKNSGSWRENRNSFLKFLNDGVKLLEQLGNRNPGHAAGILDGNAIAVFTAIGMCWSGFLSTHTAMLDSMGYRKVISKALGSHAIAGLCAGIIAHFLYLLVSLI